MSNKKLKVFNRRDYANGTPHDDCTVEMRAEFIDQTIWSREFSWPEVQVLGEFVRAFVCGKGATVIQERDRENYLCIIVSGHVEIWKSAQNNQKKQLSTVTAGRTFGEMALIDDEPRSASVITGEKTKIIVMTKIQFDQLCEEHPKIANKILHRISRLLSQRLRRTSGTLVDLIGN